MHKKIDIQHFSSRAIGYKLVACKSDEPITLEHFPQDYTFKKLGGLSELGITGATLQKIQGQIKTHREKKEIKILNIARDGAFVNIEIEIHVLGEAIKTTLTNFAPLLNIQKAEITTQIKELEKEGMDWAKRKELYPQQHLPMLEDTFCSGLVHVCYPERMMDEGKPTGEGFTVEQLSSLDKWMRALFANDEERDDFSLLETAHNVRKDNQRIIQSLESDSPETSHKVAAMKEVLSAPPIPKVIPRYFMASLEQYLDSTVTEASFQESLNWPSITTLHGIKGVSSGSYHAIDAGAMMLEIDADSLTQNTNLQFIAQFAATSVESHNDILSHGKEVRARLENLRQLLINIDHHFEKIAPYLDAHPSEIDQIEDKNLQYLVRFCLKIRETNHTEKLDTLPTNDALLRLLDLLPSFNSIDVDIHYSKTTLQEAYLKSSKRGNEAIRSMQEQITLFKTSVKEETVRYPKEFNASSTKKESFKKQAIMWINISRGWGSQLLWALTAKRYNQGLSDHLPPSQNLIHICKTCSTA